MGDVSWVPLTERCATGLPTEPAPVRQEAGAADDRDAE